MDETEEIIRLCVRALAAQMIAAPGIELHMTAGCLLGLTDEPLADHNRLMLGADPDAEGFLVRSAARAKERGRPLTAVVSPRVAETLMPVAARLGFTAVGSAPLMVLRPDVPVRPGRPVRIVRALGPELAGVAGDLIAAAFDEPRDVVARCIEVSFTATSGVETYIAFGDEGPMCTVSVTPTGDTAGITLMATPPEHQGKGMGRALLSQVIADYRSRGVTRFHLGATEAGRPLYKSLGFETIADLPVWLLQASAEVLTTIEPQVFVTDMPRALAFYAETLGFSVGFTWGEPPFYAQVVRDGAMMNLRHVDRPALDRSAGADLLSAAIGVSNARLLFQEFLARGATFHQPLTREPWHGQGQGAFIVEDPDGNLLLFGGRTD
ncbi:MAG TPA: GNAT family N-acetyltransferase [Caulobacteraceae bacterium]|nr:GNAT family N-acetyltransferase [Caulobacteraceae bacterium]